MCMWVRSQVGLSCYLVLLSTDHKTRIPGFVISWLQNQVTRQAHLCDLTHKWPLNWLVGGTFWGCGQSNLIVSPSEVVLIISGWESNDWSPVWHQASSKVSDNLTLWPLGNFNEIFRYVIFKQMLVIDGWNISCDCEIALMWMSLDFTEDQSTLVQVMAWCRQATSHYLSQC